MGRKVKIKRLIIDTDKLRHNITTIKNMTNSKIIGVLKGNGYGLGTFEFANFLLANGIDMFAVSDMEDALYLSERGFQGNVLLLTPVNTIEEAELIIKNKLIPSIGSIESALIINKAALNLGSKISFHLKIDTGFGRFGILPSEIIKFCTLLKTMEGLQLSGTYSHFSFSFSPKEKDVNSQYNKFITGVNLIKEYGIEPGILHICNSSAFLRFPQMHLGAVRIGSAFLGRIPIENEFNLQKVGYLKAKLIEIKALPKNHNIGYANTYKTREAKRIGIVPVGYLDGFGVEKSRDTFRLIDILRYIYNDVKLFRKKHYVTIAGRSIPILGRISSYNIIIDLTKACTEVGDEVDLEVNTMFVPRYILRDYI